MTQMQEQLKWSKVWCERIFIKVAARIGVPLDEFVEAFYTPDARTIIRSRAAEAPEDDSESED